MAIATVDMKHGMQVTHPGDTGTWEVLDKHPDNRTWWLHRWNDGVWETTYAHERDMSPADESTLQAPVTESNKWTAAPFNMAGNDGPRRVRGYVWGKWGTAQREHAYPGFRLWDVRHLPTGLAIGSRDTLPLARGLITRLQGESFPALDCSPFGVKPAGDATREELARLRVILDGA